MSTPVIPDGVYKIFNVSYTNFAADLIRANPLGTISAHVEDGTSNHRNWKVKNIGNNQVIFESVAAPGTFASGTYVQLRGAPLTGSPNATLWVVQSVGQNRYRITTADNQLAWYLPSPQPYDTILLQPANVNDQNAQWTFTRL